MNTEVREVTPVVAKEMLKRNGNNRKLSEGHIRFLSKEMEKGNWVFDGQPIRFTEGGVLLDGQHRLSAVIMSDMAQKFLIVTGIESGAFTVMDTGKNRNAGDIFSIEGIKNANDTAACCRLIIQHANKHTSRTISGKGKVSNSEILKFYQDNDKISEFITKSCTLRNEFSKVIPTSQIAAFSYMMAGKSVTHSEEFWNKLCTGIGLNDGSPIKILRKKLIDDRVNKASLPLTEKSALIFKAWNSFRKGESVKFLRWNKENEKFPTLI